MSNYNIFPAVDENYDFPLPVQERLPESAPVRASLVTRAQGSLQGVNLNNYIPSGFYWADAPSANAPDIGAWHYDVMSHNELYANMVARAFDGVRVMERSRVNGVWNAWVPQGTWATANAKMLGGAATAVVANQWNTTYWRQIDFDPYGLILNPPNNWAFGLRWPGLWQITGSVAVNLTSDNVRLILRLVSSDGSSNEKSWVGARGFFSETPIQAVFNITTTTPDVAMQLQLYSSVTTTFSVGGFGSAPEISIRYMGRRPI